jgi:hypothetical protein
MDILTAENDMTGRRDPASDAKAAVAARYTKPTVEDCASSDDDDKQEIKRPYRIESPGMWTF